MKSQISHITPSLTILHKNVNLLSFLINIHFILVDDWKINIVKMSLFVTTGEKELHLTSKRIHNIQWIKPIAPREKSAWIYLEQENLNYFYSLRKFFFTIKKNMFGSNVLPIL